MTDINEGLDPDLREIRAEFIDEALESLSTVAGLFVALEADPGNNEIIQSIFRPVHSIKGNASFFGMMKTTALAHELETLLDLIRNDALAASPAIIDVLLGGTDELVAMIERVRGEEDEVPDEGTFAKLLQKVRASAEGEKADEEALWLTLLGGLENGEGEAQADGQKKKLEQLLDTAKLLARLLPAGRKALGELSGEAEPATSEPEPTQVSADKKESPADTAPVAAAQAKPAKAVGKTMRIPEESIDAFLAYVGDLVTIGEMYQHLYVNLSGHERNQEVSVELRRVNEAFGDLSHSLQTSIMNIRKVPMNTILKRAPRIIRDVASASGKQIETNVSGGDLMVDKSLVDTLEAPLIHMTRNAADHGVEPVAVREQAGKPPAGTIEITATETAEEIILAIKDDGQGLDRNALARKATELGLISAGAELSEEDIVSLLFMSGVSTAKKVTDVSGRGVGMDVVRRNIEEMGGLISVTSEREKGSEFTVRLPKTISTQILTGFIVVSGANRYIFPLDRIVRCFRHEESAVTTIPEKGACVKDGDRLLRICRLADVFGQENTADDDLRQGIMVVVEVKKENIALHVDKIEGLRQVVLKELEGIPQVDDLFQGGAVMGDGSVAMIVNLDYLVGTPE